MYCWWSSLSNVVYCYTSYVIFTSSKKNSNKSSSRVLMDRHIPIKIVMINYHYSLYTQSYCDTLNYTIPLKLFICICFVQPPLLKHLINLWSSDIEFTAQLPPFKIWGLLNIFKINLRRWTRPWNTFRLRFRFCFLLYTIDYCYR